MIVTREPDEIMLKAAEAYGREALPEHTFYGVLFREGTYYENRPFTPTRHYCNHVVVLRWYGDSVGHNQMHVHCDKRISAGWPGDDDVVALDELTPEQREELEWGFCSKCSGVLKLRLEELDRLNAE
jgi:hypothetical protein